MILLMRPAASDVIDHSQSRSFHSRLPLRNAVAATVIEPPVVSVGEAAKQAEEEAKSMPPEPEALRGHTPPNARPKAQAAQPSPYLITPDHVKRVSNMHTVEREQSGRMPTA